MVFDFFHKNEKEKSVREHLGGFQDGFSPKQKKAILCSMFLIANSDQEFHIKEQQFFEETALLLGYRLTENMIDDFMTLGGRDELFNLLNSLDEGQKDWYIITSLGMMHADGKPLDIELKHLMTFYDHMGITEERASNVVQKADALSRHFNL
jgi:uncharacterized tellurite resistance protein B-like protein